MSSPRRLLTPKRVNPTKWSVTENRALVQFVATHGDLLPADSSNWPMVKNNNSYWSEAARYVEETSGATARKGISYMVELAKFRMW